MLTFQLVLALSLHVVFLFKKCAVYDKVKNNRSFLIVIAPNFLKTGNIYCSGGLGPGSTVLILTSV